jgi:hypothetical protein
MTNLFVSSFINVYNDRKELKSVDFCFKQFEKLAESGIDIVLFVSHDIESILIPILEKYPNIRIHRVLKLEDTWTWSVFNRKEYNLPVNRFPPKDKKEYFSLINCKIEFLNEIINDTQYNEYTGFVWIDFSIFHVIKNIEVAQKNLQLLSIKPINSLIIPGCWESPYLKYEQITNSVYWRFCGGIIVGNRENLNLFWMVKKIVGY